MSPSKTSLRPLIYRVSVFRWATLYDISFIVSFFVFRTSFFCCDKQHLQSFLSWWMNKSKIFCWNSISTQTHQKTISIKQVIILKTSECSVSKCVSYFRRSFNITSKLKQYCSVRIYYLRYDNIRQFLCVVGYEKNGSFAISYIPVKTEI